MMITESNELVIDKSNRQLVIDADDGQVSISVLGIEGEDIEEILTAWIDRNDAIAICKHLQHIFVIDASELADGS